MPNGEKSSFPHLILFFSSRGLFNESASLHLLLLHLSSLPMYCLLLTISPCKSCKNGILAQSWTFLRPPLGWAWLWFAVNFQLTAASSQEYSIVVTVLDNSLESSDSLPHRSMKLILQPWVSSSSQPHFRGSFLWMKLGGGKPWTLSSIRMLKEQDINLMSKCK